MQIHRFFCPLTLENNTRIRLPDHITHYAGRVLRLKNNTEIVLFNGKGGQYKAAISFQNKLSYAQILSHEDIENELSGQINLFQGIASANKMDFIIEKATELGVSKVFPIAANHSVLQLQGQRLEKRLAHWQNVSYAASEQCGRNRVLSVQNVTPLKEALATQIDNKDIINNQLTLMCHPGATENLSTVVKRFKQQACESSEMLTLNLIVGPEGGWSNTELEMAQTLGAQMVEFGSRILRTETAGIALSAACTALLDW